MWNHLRAVEDNVQDQGRDDSGGGSTSDPHSPGGKRSPIINDVGDNLQDSTGRFELFLEREANTYAHDSPLFEMLSAIVIYFLAISCSSLSFE